MNRLFIISLLLLFGFNITLAEETVKTDLKKETTIDCEKAMREPGAYPFLPTTLPVECQGRREVKTPEPEEPKPDTKIDKVMNFLFY